MNVKPIEEDTLFLRKTISDLTEQIDQLTVLQDISKQIISKFDFNQIINTFLDLVNEIINYNSCILYLYHGDSNSYRVSGLRGVSEKDLKSYELDYEIIDWVLKEGRWAHISSFKRPDQKNNSFISILPLQGAKRDLGFLLIFSDPEKDVFTQANMKHLSFVASQTGIALENQDLYSKLSHSEEYIKNILESINNGIITMDTEDRITQINKNATAMLGLPSGDIIGVNYKDTLLKI